MKILDLQSQLNHLVKIVQADDIVMGVLRDSMSNKIGAWLGAGCINQRVWNYLTKREITYGIDDYDLIYYDATDTTQRAQTLIQDHYNKVFPEINVECTNQARVHLWYKEYFGYTIDPITSVEDAIDYWPTTASAIGVCLRGNQISLYAPRGLTDLFMLTLRPNKGRITKTIYQEKVKKWTQKWKELNVIEWNQA